MEFGRNSKTSTTMQSLKKRIRGGLNEGQQWIEISDVAQALNTGRA
jgi:hypothetical protein